MDEQNQRLSDLRTDTQRQFADVHRQISEVKTAITTLVSDYQNFYGLE